MAKKVPFVPPVPTLSKAPIAVTSVPEAQVVVAEEPTQALAEMSPAAFVQILPDTLPELEKFKKKHNGHFTEEQLNVLDKKIDKTRQAELAAASERSLSERGFPDHSSVIKQSRQLLKEPVPSGLRLFEAPDGYVMYGEKDETQVWYRMGNGGRGMWINPHR